jgi:hypothetical protein
MITVEVRRGINRKFRIGHACPFENSPSFAPLIDPPPSRVGNAAGQSRNVMKDILKTAKHQAKHHDDFS